MIGTARPWADQSFVDKAARTGGQDILSVSLHGSFANVEDVGTRMLVADGDKAKARRWPKPAGLFAMRDAAVSRFLTSAGPSARRLTTRAVITADRADNAGSGAPGDSTFVCSADQSAASGRRCSASSGIALLPDRRGSGHRRHARLRIGGNSRPAAIVDCATVKNIVRGAQQTYGR